MISKGSLYGIMHAITPPIIFSSLKKSTLYPKMQKWADRNLKKDRFTPTWNDIKGGVLKGRKIFIYETGVWKDMISGEYDTFFVEYLQKLDLRGKVIYDIGAHFGYSAMCFAQLVGPTGRVLAFEPNLSNKKRFEYFLTENKDLADIIEIHDVAISNKIGEEDFNFNDNLDDGTSSGSFIESSHTFYEKESYEKNLGYRKVKTKTVSLDTLNEIGVTETPFLIKIDIEGAEYLAMEGAMQLLRTHKPILLIEIHSIFNMLKVGQILHELDYTIELLKEEKDGRCFIAAV
jgi:FkbM family methyltransferase